MRNEDDWGYRKRYVAFNRQVSETRFNQIKDRVRDILHNVIFDINQKYGDNWEQVTDRQWIKLSEIPEFDKSVVEQITGLDLTCLCVINNPEILVVH